MISDIQEAFRAARIAMNVIKRDNSSTECLAAIYMIYYGFVGTYTEQVQVCAQNLSRGEVKMNDYVEDFYSSSADDMSHILVQIRL